MRPTGGVFETPVLKQRVVMWRVGVTIKQIENKHLQNVLIFRVWIIWGEQKKFGRALLPNAHRGYGPVPVGSAKRNIWPLRNFWPIIFVGYFACQRKETKFGDYFLDVCCIN